MMALMGKPKRIRDPRLPRLEEERKAMHYAVDQLLNAIQARKSAEVAKPRRLQ